VSRASLFAVIGSPILHSLSPILFSAAFAERKANSIYTRLAADTAEDALSLANELGVLGLNVTSPFKEEILPLLNHIEGAADVTGAVNTISFRDGRPVGYNTDPDGVMAMFQSAGFDPKRKKALVIGAGGAARAACYVLKKMGASEILILGRSEERTKRVCNAFGAHLMTSDQTHEAAGSADAIISCLPRGTNILEPGWLTKNQMVFDANYGSLQIRNTAHAAGAKFYDGLEWLMGQALESYRILTGDDPPEDAMRDALLDNAARKESGGHFILTGMMGSGKTEIGKRLADLAGLDFIDTDTMVEERCGRNIADIFESTGEAAFRELERSAVRDALNQKRSVIALGGGALVDVSTADLAAIKGTVAWLFADPKTLTERASNGRRPLLDSEEPLQRMKAILKKRFDSYVRCADIVLSTTNRTAEDTARKIFDEANSSEQD